MPICDERDPHAQDPQGGRVDGAASDAAASISRTLLRIPPDSGVTLLGADRDSDDRFGPRAGARRTSASATNAGSCFYTRS